MSVAVPQGNRFKQAWTAERVIEAVQSWAEEYGQPPSSTEWEVGKPEKYARAALNKAQLWQEKAARFADGTYPSNDTVRRFFGSFNAAIAAAGFPPRPEGRTPRASAPPVMDDGITDRMIEGLARWLVGAFVSRFPDGVTDEVREQATAALRAAFA